MRWGPRFVFEEATTLGPGLSDRLSFSPPLQAQSDAEALAGALDKDEGRASPCTPSTPSVCSPPSAASSVPSAGKNICSSCGLEILDRYLLKVKQGRVCWRGVRCSPEGCGEETPALSPLRPEPCFSRCLAERLQASLSVSLRPRGPA